MPRHASTTPSPQDSPPLPSGPGGPPAPQIRRWFRRVFEVDLRALAAFRILIGVILIWDLLVRSLDIEAHYTDAGVLPRTVLIDSYLSLRPYLSLHIMHGSTLFESLLFIAAGLCAAALLVGYRSRITCASCWFLTVSLHARNPLVLHGGDDILRMLLFWAMFVPLGARWSVDRIRVSEIDSNARSVCTPGTAGLMLQLLFMYFFSGLLKSHPSWRSEGTAVYLALSIDQFATPIARALLPYHGFLRLLTYSTLVLELGGPILALVSFIDLRLRTAIVVSFILFHIGLGMCLELGIFPVVCIAGWLVFVPGPVWDTLERRLGPRLSRWRSAVSPRIAAFVSRQVEEIERRPIALRSSMEGNVFAAFFLVYIFLWNLRTCDFDTFAHIFPRSLNGVGEAARVDQYWNLFAPYPSLEHGWYVADAHLRDGSEVDLLTGKPVTWDRPALVSATYRNERWRKYLMNLWTGQFANYRPYYAQYLHRVWNDRHPPARQLARLQIVFVLETALPQYRLAPQKRVKLWTQDWSQ